MGYLLQIRQGLREALSDPKAILLGEDIEDPFGGCFKVTRGLSTEFPGRVINTPISEACIMGIANGLAARGYKPIIEIMFCDFITLIADQVINHSSIFDSLWGIPTQITIRTAVGDKSYGPSHSKNLSHLLEGHLKVYDTKNEKDVYGLFMGCFNYKKASLFVEYKDLY